VVYIAIQDSTPWLKLQAKIFYSIESNYVLIFFYNISEVTKSSLGISVPLVSVF